MNNLYSYIVNPETGRSVSLNGKIGQKVIKNYLDSLQLGGSFGASLKRGLKSAKASAGRNLKKAGKNISKGASDTKKELRRAKDQAAWDAMSNERKCGYCNSMGDLTSYDNMCFKLNKDKTEKLAAKNKAKEDKISALREQMNMHYNQAYDFGAAMQPDAQADSMLEARLLAKEIASITGEPYQDPFQQGKKPETNPNAAK
jgi:hypothetical protein